MKLCGFDVGLDKPFFLIAGPAWSSPSRLQMDTAGQLKEITAALGIPFIFKSSFDKANRSSAPAFAARAWTRAWKILAKVQARAGLPVLTDVHSEADRCARGRVVDVLQTPAFLCRQTDFIRAVAQSGKPVNIKKGQFLAPHDMKNVIDKARAAARKPACPKTASWPANAA
jgi:2-dehydro-3-deoxyphosphooctonate aldolase (KDO 8-P synthase)